MRSGRRGGRVVVAAVILTLVVGGSLVVLALGVPHGVPSSIRVVRVWSDSVDSARGMSFYLLDVNATNGQSSAWQVDPSHFALTSNASRAYAAVANYGEAPLLHSSSLPPGQTVTGEVVFLLPDGEVPAKLTYDDHGVSLQTSEIPAPSGVASKFDPSVHVEFAGTPAASAVASWNGITNQSNGLTFFGEEHGFRNYSFVFFTGQKIYVTFALFYYKFPYDPQTISVVSVTSDDGYALSDVVGWQSFFWGRPVPWAAGQHDGLWLECRSDAACHGPSRTPAGRATLHHRVPG